MDRSLFSGAYKTGRDVYVERDLPGKANPWLSKRRRIAKAQKVLSAAAKDGFTAARTTNSIHVLTSSPSKSTRATARPGRSGPRSERPFLTKKAPASASNSERSQSTAGSLYCHPTVTTTIGNSSKVNPLRGPHGPLSFIALDRLDARWQCRLDCRCGDQCVHGYPETIHEASHWRHRSIHVVADITPPARGSRCSGCEGCRQGP